MIADDKDKIISQLTVRLRNTKSDSVIGTGILYYEINFKDKAYILTAAHCLFSDGDNFGEKLESIKIDILNSSLDKYESIVIDNIEDDLIFKDVDKDIAVIIIDRDIIEKITGAIPKIEVSIERHKNYKFITKGFPKATQGEELDAIFPIWKQKMTEVNKFQLELTESYSDYNTQGFSGSGIFLIANNTVYLFGIFTRFRSEDKGKVVYCQYIYLINQLLTNKFLPTISISFLGNNGLSSSFFKNHLKKSVKNLGPRFNEELNFKLPVAKLFNDLSFDNNFKSRFFKVLDSWLMAVIHDEFTVESDLKFIDIEYFDLKQKVKEWGVQTPIGIENPINIDWITHGINRLNEKLDFSEERIRELQFKEEEKRRKEEKKEKREKHYSTPRPYEKELNRLRKISRINNDLLIDLDEKINISLSNNPILIIDGEAGSGKSHLLGDIANERLKNNTPTILLLGQHFTTSRSLEDNITHLLNIKCSFEELISDLNNIGKQIGTRVLILIDAINEGAGAKLWRDQILGLLSVIKHEPFVGIAISIRTTYLKSIISDQIKADNDITFKTHLGFKGNEYAALKMFCDFHKLKQPSFPILSPEFTNPLFLKIICEGVKNSETKEFPQGFQGVRKIFDLFIKAIDKKLERKRSYYINRKLVIKVIHELAFKIFESEYRRVLIDDAFLIMDEKFPKFDELLNDLIEEGIFIKNLYNDYKKEEDVEVIYFAYERFGDFYIANELLKEFNSKKDVLDAFKQGTKLGRLLEDDYYMQDGVLEAMSTLLPEVFGLEIFETYAWVYKKLDKFKNLNTKELFENNEVFKYGNLSSHLSQFFLDGLNWRTIESIDNDKITNWLQNTNHRIDDDEWFFKLIELTAINNHPMNSDRLFRILSRYSMAERDSFWQNHLRYFSGFDDNENAFPIRRLIDWAWSNGITNLIDEETARLSGQTLAWMLASTNKALRDQTTKALVNILEEQPDALISILKAFNDNNDFFITERLFAVAYGCTLRTSKDDTIKAIATYVYNTVFKNGNPPSHILLRDYSRNIVEYAIYKNLQVDYDPKLLRPPYNSEMPLIPNEDDINKYKADYKSKGYDKDLGGIYNGIHHSVMDWDFGNKTVDPEVNHFSGINFRNEKKYEKFYKSLKKSQKGLLLTIKKNFISKEKIISQKSRYRNASSEEEEKYNSLLETLNELHKEEIELINVIFEKEKIEFVSGIAIPYLENLAKVNSNIYDNRLSSYPFRKWIVNRVFQFGYNMKLHGRFDKQARDFDYRSDRNSTKIGTKYQWIALHEILSYIADNHKIESRNDFGKEYNYYNGTWQLYVRDIDPASTTKTKDEYSSDDDFDSDSDKINWWSKVEYNYWDKTHKEWSESLDDLPNLKEVIVKKDDENVEWVYLEYFPSWKEPKKLGADKYRSRKNLHYLIQGYIVKNDDRTELINYLENKNFFGRWMPENGDSYSNLFNRENFWSPAYLDNFKEEQWREICDNKKNMYHDKKVMVATTNAKGGFEKDKSGANFNYNIPCKFLFEGLELEYSNIDGDFINKQGEKIVTNISEKGTLIRKKELFNFLNNNNLSIIWTLLGEKIAESEDRYYHFGVPCGVFYFEKNNFKGKLQMYTRDD
jgi:hypothetical protein